ncbi:MAG: hypothetical protein ACLFMN_08050, partial [Desulfobacterales bacterium]
FEMAKKKVQDQGAQIPRNAAYLIVREIPQGCSATQILDFSRSHHNLKTWRSKNGKAGLWRR